ncbi:alanine--tRNA ligase [Halobaculum sp. MBLA0147]|uniref:alanine--tRNA ligase n=1 Tax=Halobaculum sp. MBLA0147 TaxID=3079934 RepID=UPI003525D59E
MTDLTEAYRLDYFEEEGFTRTECSSCGAHFWTRDHDRELCGEPPCEEYSFVDDPGFDREYTLEEMREAFLSYFEAHDHERVSPYPVAANRWRDDVLLTQASIYDFQPHVTSGQSPPPANPLAVSQPCIRMQDIDNVGRTGRHTMAFEMMGHHAFNADPDTDYAYEGEVYWKDECVEFCEGFFAEFGVDLSELTFIEDPWVGGGNAGPAFEVIYRGAELATLVFMSMERDPDGEYEMKDGNRYTQMDRRVVDTGYGLERWTWMSQGTPTVYEAVYPEAIEFLKDNAGIEHTDEEAALINRASKLAGKLDIDDVEDFAAARAEIADELDVDADRLTELLEPLEDIYAVADHCRTLAYMFGDEIVPSNVGTGYLARMVLRRTKRLVDRVGIDAPLDELVDMQAERLGYENRDLIRDVVRTEVRKYRETLERGRRRVRQLAEEYADADEPVPTEELVELYDSHGIQPDTVAEIASEEGAAVDVPDDFYGLVAERHDAATGGTATSERDERVAELPETDRLYYDDQERTEFEAVVLDVFERADGDFDVVLDQTMFYPEGGGQPADHGTLSTEETTVDVTDVQIHDGVVLHRTDADPGTGEFVRGQLDADRRRRLMRHHTATHVVGYAARQVLGDHVRQAGAQKGVDSARLDVTHYDRITRTEVEEIERVANELVRENVPVTQSWPGRNEAEAEYGFDLYQGGIPPGEEIRVVEVGPDVQACGGTHVARTGDLGVIKLSTTEPVQDGVERLVFAAGDAAIEATHREENALYEAAAVLDVDPLDVPETAERFFTEWKERGKEIERLKQELAEVRASATGDTVDVGDAEAVVRRVDGDTEELRATANALVEEGTVAVLGSGAGGSATFVVGVPEGVGVDAGEVVAELASRVGGGGGGPPDFAQGGGPDVDALDDALAAAPDVLTAVRDA